MSGRPRLLFLCHTLPYPPDGGAWIRSYHVLRLLAGTFDVTALCFERAGDGPPARTSALEAGRRALSDFADVEVFPIPQRHSRLRYLRDHFRSVALGRVYTRYLYESHPFRARLDSLLTSLRFDLIHVDSLDLAGYLTACRGLPVACVHHDIESILLRRRAAVERARWRRAYMRHQAALMERVERRWCERVALNVVVSESDREVLTRIAPGSRVTVVPNGVDLEQFGPGDGEGRGLAFVGGTAPFPNRDALDFFSTGILPHLRAAGRDFQIRWIGRASPDQQQHYAHRYGIDLTGYVSDVTPLMRDAACHIVPLRVAGGTRLKILNSWAMAKAVVSTSVGCEGLAAVDGENILIRDDPREFAEAITAVLDDQQLRRRLGESGRATAERLYGWNAIGAEMTRRYLGLAKESSGSANTVPAAATEPRYGSV